MTFGAFVAQRFEPGILPSPRYARQKRYGFLLCKHLLPRFRDVRLCDIRRAEIQQYLIEKLKRGYAWETSNHLCDLMSKICSTAVSWDYPADNPVRGVRMPERTFKRPHRFLSMDQVRRLIPGSDEPVRTIVLLAAMT